MRMVYNAYIVGTDDGGLMLRGGVDARVIGLHDEPTSKLPALFKNASAARHCIRRSPSFTLTPSANAYRKSMKGLDGNPKEWLKAIPCTLTIDT